MNRNFLSHSFKTRAKVSVGIVLLTILGALTPNSYGLRLLYTIAATLSIFEIYTITTSLRQPSRDIIVHSFISFLILVCSNIAVHTIPKTLLIIGIILTMTSDVGAYLVGKICGAKIIHARPFPTVSPNKSWEGVIGGLLIPSLTVPFLNWLFQDSIPGRPLSMTIGCLVGFCAIIGDASESSLKRRCDVKDANDILKNTLGFRHIEALLGGSEGHGGYYDRLDSMSVVLLLIGIVTVICTSSPWSRR